MKKLRLKVSNIGFNSYSSSWDEKVEEVLSLERKFQAIDVAMFSVEMQNAAKSLEKIIARHGSQIREMVIRDVTLNNHDELSRLLEDVPLLEELEIIDLRFKTPGKLEEIKPTVFRQLQTLNVQNSSWAIFQHLIGSQISSLRTTRSVCGLAEGNYIKNFLEASEKLESIELDKFAFMMLFRDPLQFKNNFKLKKFKYFCFQLGQEEDENFNAFLISQSSSIEELILNNASLNVVETILSKMNNLKMLRISSGSLPNEKEFLSSFKPLKNLKDIEAHDEFLHQGALKGLLQTCPNLETFKAVHDESGIISDSMQFFAAYTPKLKSLTISSLQLGEDPLLKLPNLKNLHVKNIPNMDNILTLLKNNPTIETFSVGNAESETFTENALETFMNETSLKQLKFTGFKETIKSIFNRIKIDCISLKSVELIDSEEFNTNSQKVLQRGIEKPFSSIILNFNRLS